MGSIATDTAIRIANRFRMSGISQRGEYSSARPAIGQVAILSGCRSSGFETDGNKLKRGEPSLRRNLDLR
jgi:hypothetical protein